MLSDMPYQAQFVKHAAQHTFRRAVFVTHALTTGTRSKKLSK
jgi:hypothetical protein